MKKIKQKDRKSISRRFKIIEGHIKKITNMIDDDEYCIDILQQTTAVKNAIKNAEVLLLEQHLHSCLLDSIRKENSQSALQEVLEIFRKANK